MRTIYWQLASALHPDRETDPAERTRKTTPMSEANAACGRRDLLAMQSDFRRVQDDAEFKRWLREQHRLARDEDNFDRW